MNITAIQTGVVRVKPLFIKGSVGVGGMLPFLVKLHSEREFIDIPIYAWAIEHAEGVIIVDTGDSSASVSDFVTATRYVIAPEEEIGPQLAARGIKQTDIAKVVLTHIHGDHVRGLKHFQNAPIYLRDAEYTDARTLLNRAITPLPAGLSPTLFSLLPEPLGPFAQSYPLTRDGTVIAVPTPGHTPGHISVVVRDGDLSYFLSGDITYTEAALLDQALQGPTRAPKQQVETLRKTLDFVQSSPTIYLPSHDPQSAARLAVRQLTHPHPAAGTMPSRPR